MESVLSVLSLVLSAATLAVALAALLRLRGDSSADSLGALREDLASARQALDALAVQQGRDNAALEAAVEHAARSCAQISARMDALRADVTAQLAQSSRATDERLASDRSLQDRKLEAVGASVNQQLGTLNATVNQQLARVGDTVSHQVESMSARMGESLETIRRDTGRQLDAMRATVDEKLTKTLDERLAVSFRSINASLEAVHQGLGTMQSLASNVGDLRRVLSNVKTRGILGEVQLGAILSEVLAPGQYEENVAVKPRSKERVEFAVKVPQEDGGFVLLPIDAKFPGDTYTALLDAQDAGDAPAVEAARKALAARICQEAKDISSKYISVPASTNFALMFLPFEGLYAEVVSMPGLIERLQREYSVNVAGPSTMAALLNSLQMCYQTVALQKKADEVLAVLQGVKSELPKYQRALAQAKRQIDTAGRTVESIITTRTNQMERRLRDIALPEGLEAPEVVVEDEEGPER